MAPQIPTEYGPPAAVNQAYRLQVIAWAAFIFVYLAVIQWGHLQELAALWWSDTAWTLASLAAGLKCLHTARHERRPRRRRAWSYFGFAALAWFGGMLIWDYMELVLETVLPYPSTADAFFLAFAPLFMFGAFYYRVEAPSLRFRLTQFGNLGIIFCTVFVVTLIVLYPSILVSGQSSLFVGTAIAYAIFYLLAFIFTLFCYWFFAWHEHPRPFVLLLGALFVHAAAVVLYAFQLLGESYGAANYINVYWLIAFALQYVAALEQDRLRTAELVTEREPPGEDGERREHDHGDPSHRRPRARRSSARTRRSCVAGASPPARGRTGC